MRQISLVGAVDEEVGDYFPEFLDMLEESPFLKVGGRFFIYLYIYIFHWTIFTHALTHTHTRDVYSFRSETGCVLTRVAAGIMFSAPTARRIHNRSALLCTSGGESLNMLNAVCVSQEAH